MPSSAELVCIDPKQVEKIWPVVKGLIHSAVRRTDLNSFSDIEDAVLDGNDLLWLALDGNAILAAATTQLVRTETKPVCVLVACGGDDMTRWLPLLEKIEDYAKAEGCSRVRIYGRKGWQRVLANYAVKHVILERSL